MFAFPCHLQDRSALVGRIFRSSEETFAFGPIDEFPRTVVFQPQAFGGVCNRDRCSLRGSRDLQEKLMLLRVQARFLRSAFAEMQKSAYLEPKFSQGSKERVQGVKWGL